MSLTLCSLLFLPFFGGKKPSNKKRSVGSPDVVNAANKALGPGIDSIFTPALIASLVSLYAGSDIPGVPASVITAIFSPFIKLVIKDGIRIFRLYSK